MFHLFKKIHSNNKSIVFKDIMNTNSHDNFITNVQKEDIHTADIDDTSDNNTTSTITTNKSSSTSTTNKSSSTSAYFSLFYDGTNYETANKMGDMFTYAHSQKIKDGNNLEQLVFNDAKENPNPLKLTTEKVQKYNKDIHKGLENLKRQAPCLISGYRLQKEMYLSYGVSFKNKKEVELDFLYVDENLNISIFELKHGCDFDTKKSKGEIESLTSTTTLLQKSQLFEKINAFIVCYDAKKKQDIKIKSQLSAVKLIVYEDMAELVGIKEKSRERIDKKKQIESKKRYNEMIMTMQCIINSHMKITEP